ncbi:DUF4431 domain-containing protein [Enterobacter soli]|uniref:DUF4431 domain-containing protein n=1 Tax=Enterobacter soli TaxID=885040 RepID=UPI0034CEFC25
MLKKILKTIFCFMIVFSSLSGFARCLKEGDKVSLKGVISIKLYYGPPGWGEDKNNDEKLHEWILHLKRPLTCVTDVDTNNQNWNQDVQLIMRDSKEYKFKENYIGKTVNAYGVIFLAENGYHMTPVLLDDARLEVADK